MIFVVQLASQILETNVKMMNLLKLLLYFPQTDGRVLSKDTCRIFLKTKIHFPCSSSSSAQKTGTGNVGFCNGSPVIGAQDHFVVLVVITILYFELDIEQSTKQ